MARKKKRSAKFVLVEAEVARADLEQQLRKEENCIGGAEGTLVRFKAAMLREAAVTQGFARSIDDVGFPGGVIQCDESTDPRFISISGEVSVYEDKKEKLAGLGLRLRDHAPVPVTQRSWYVRPRRNFMLS